MEFADKGMGPQVPALSSTTLPNLLDVIDHLQLRVPPLSQGMEPPKEHKDLLESLTMKDAPKPSSSKDIYQKFLNVLREWPSVQNSNPALEPGDQTPDPNLGDPPLPPGCVDPPLPPGCVDPPPNPEVPMNSDWEPGKILTTDEDPKRMFTYRNPLFNNPFSLPPKVSNPIPPIIHSDLRAGDGRPMGGVHEGSGEVPPPPPGDTPMNHPKEDPPAEKEKETSSQKVAKASKNVAHPSKTPSKALKYTDNKCTILDPHRHPMANLRLMDVVKNEKSTGSGASKHKEPDT